MFLTVSKKPSLIYNIGGRPEIARVMLLIDGYV